MSTVNLLESYAEIIYPNIPDHPQNQYTNVLLIHKSVSEYQTFVDSVNANTFHIVFSSASSSTELLGILRRYFTSIPRIGICFTSTLDTPPLFIDNESMFTNNETMPYSNNVQLVVSMIQEFSVTNMDFLACDTLHYLNWRNYYDLLRQSTGVIVGASDNKTGNIKYGGDWILESTSQDIETVYFTQSIQYYSYLLDNLSFVTSSITGSQGINAPVGITTDGTYLYVGNNNSSLYGYSGSITRISIANPSVYTNNWANPTTHGFNAPWGLAISGGYLYAASANQATISKISLTNPSTDYTTNWATSTQGMQYQCQIAIDGNYLYTVYRTSPITVARIARISLSNPSGDYNSSWATNAVQGFLEPTGLTAYNGNIYASNGSTGVITRISIANPTTNFTTNWATGYKGLCGLYAFNNYLYSSEQSSGKIARINILNPTDINLNWSSPGAGTCAMTSASNNLYAAILNTSVIAEITLTLPTIPVVICFKKDSRILTNTGYRKIQYLKKGDSVKTLKHGFVPIYRIGKKEIVHIPTLERSKNHLYKCSPSQYPELFDDLVLTGCHSVLVDDYVDEPQLEKTIEVNGATYVTEGKYRLPVCADYRASIYEYAGKYTVYHIALENDNYYSNYGVFANGLLVESTSKRFLEKMNIMETHQ